MMDNEVTTGSAHGLESWRVNRFDYQSTIYTCKCGWECGQLYGLKSHVQYGNADLL